MARIPFDIKYRPQIESGEYKVFAHEHEEQEARIVCWDNKGEYPIVALVDNEPEKFDKYGRVPGGNLAGEFSLFIVTPEEEEELSEFESNVRTCITENLTNHVKDGNSAEMSFSVFIDNDTTKKLASELLSLVREQLIKDGYIIEKKAFHDAVENISDKHRAEMSVEYSLHCKIEDGTRHAIMNWEAFQKVAQKFINIGKAEALKDLPRWCVNVHNIDSGVSIDWRKGEAFICYKGKIISLKDLEKLPGFKED